MVSWALSFQAGGPSLSWFGVTSSCRRLSPCSQPLLHGTLGPVWMQVGPGVPAAPGELLVFGLSFQLGAGSTVQCRAAPTPVFLQVVLGLALWD